jgi:hypothetical protein
MRSSLQLVGITQIYAACNLITPKANRARGLSFSSHSSMTQEAAQGP